MFIFQLPCPCSMNTTGSKHNIILDPTFVLWKILVLKLHREVVSRLSLHNVVPIHLGQQLQGEGEGGRGGEE